MQKSLCSRGGAAMEPGAVQLELPSPSTGQGGVRPKTLATSFNVGRESGLGEVMHATRSRRLPVRSMHLRCLSCVATEMVNPQRGQPSHIDTPYHPIKCLAQAEHVAPRTRNPGACVLQLGRNKASCAVAVLWYCEFFNCRCSVTLKHARRTRVGQQRDRACSGR